VANATNPGNTLYVTGLSSRVTERDLEDHFNKEGKVSSILVFVSFSQWLFPPGKLIFNGCFLL
jgi:RNA recognition motif-containing protein